MAIGRITGPMLQSNLERQGYDIAIDGNVAYFDVSNRRLGVSIANPQYTLDVYGNARVANLTILGNTITSNIGQIAITSNVLISTGGINSTSPYTGSFKVAGGVGIANDLWIGGNIYADSIISNSAQLSIRDPLLFLSSNTTTPYNYEIGFYGHFTGGSLNVYQTSGLVRDHVDNTWTFFSNSPMPTGTTVTIGNGVILDTIKAGGANIANTTPSTSTTTGALRVAGGAGIVGALYITNTGDVSANIGARFTTFNTLNANVGAYQIWANANSATQTTNINSINANIGAYEIYANANIGTLYLGNISTNSNLGAYQTWANVTFGTATGDISDLQANIGAYQIYSNANAAAQATSINSINANVGAYEIYANANIGTLYLGNISTQANVGTLYLGNISTQANVGVLYLGNISTNANLGAYQIWANANAATQTTNINSINANLGAYQTYANANIGTLYLGNISVNANLGAYQAYANANAATQATSINTINANLGAYQTWANANASTQATSINSFNANLGAYQIYANANAATQQVTINSLVSAIYSNANVAAFLPTYTGNFNAGNVISTFYGNLSTDYISPLNTEVVSFTHKSAIRLPVGTNSDRPYASAVGQIRYNSDAATIEFYTGSSWTSLTNTITGQSFYGDGANHTYVLNNSTTSTGILVSINGTVQQPGVAYSVVGTAITFAEVPQATDLIDVRYLAMAVAPVFDTVSVDTTNLILAANANTVIDTFSTSNYRSVKYVVSGTSAESVHMAEVMAIQQDSAVWINTTSNINSSANTVSYYASNNGTTVTVTANATVSTGVRIQRTYFTI